MPDLNERLKSLRTDRNLAQVDVAKYCNISERSLKYYESGERVPDANVIIKFCDYFDVSADYLLGRSDSTN